MAIQRVSHLGICVSDLGRATAFYRDALGFVQRGALEVAGEPAARLLGLAELKLQAVYLERDGVRIELLHYAAPGALGDGAPRPMNALGMSHLSLRVADLDRAVEAVEQAGGRVLAGTRIALPAVRTRAVFVTDPDGTRLELVEAPGDPSALPGS